MKVDKHELKIKGLKATSGYMTPITEGYYEVWYDCKCGEVWANWHYNRNEWSEYHDPNVVRVARSDTHMTMQEIEDAIRDYLQHDDDDDWFV